MVQCPELSSLTSEALAWHQATAPSLWPHDSEEKGEKKKEKKNKNKIIKIKKKNINYFLIFILMKKREQPNQTSK